MHITDSLWWWWEYIGNRLIPCTKGEWRGKCVLVMTSSWTDQCEAWEVIPACTMGNYHQTGYSVTRMMGSYHKTDHNVTCHLGMAGTCPTGPIWRCQQWCCTDGCWWSHPPRNWWMPGYERITGRASGGINRVQMLIPYIYLHIYLHELGHPCARKCPRTERC